MARHAENAVATDLTLPELGEDIDSGDVVRVLVSVGDAIVEDQPIVELETDKATVEIPAAAAGTVREVRVQEGDTIQIGQVLLVLDGPASEAGSGARVTAPAAIRRPEVADVADASRPPAGAGEPADETTATVVAGASRSPAGADEPADETAATVVAGAPEDTAPDGEAPARVPPASATPAPRGEVVAIGRGQPVADREGPRAGVAAGPGVHRVARELGVDIAAVRGSGPQGRVAAEDVVAFARGLITRGRGAPGGPSETVDLPEFTRWGEVERVPMKAVRRETAQHLSHAWTTIPHVTQHDRADVTELDRLRRRYAPRAAAAGGKLTVTAIALKVVATALRAFPQFNASVDMATREIIQKRYVHIGVAVDTDRGLLVPVIRDADRKSIIDLTVELSQAAEKVKRRKITREEMEGGTFTITNLGGIGGTAFSPIVNWPEVAILGLSRSTTEPTYVEGQLQPRLLLPLSLSYDHRVIDGADAVRFLRWIAEAFEQPFLLAL